MVMSPNILEVMLFRLGLFYPVTATTVVCCILMQILCVVSQKGFSFWGTSSPRPPVPQTSYRGSDPGLWWGTSILQTPSVLLCPLNNPVRSTPLVLGENQPNTCIRHPAM